MDDKLEYWEEVKRIAFSIHITLDTMHMNLGFTYSPMLLFPGGCSCLANATVKMEEMERHKKLEMDREYRIEFERFQNLFEPRKE